MDLAFIFFSFPFFIYLFFILLSSFLQVVMSVCLTSHDFLPIRGLAYITLTEHTVWSGLSQCDVNVLSYENMRLCLKLGCICPTIPQPQEATVHKLQWQVSLCVLLFSDMVASHVSDAHTPALWFRSVSTVGPGWTTSFPVSRRVLWRLQPE